MSTNAAEYYDNHVAAMKPVREAVLALIKGFGNLHQSTMKSAALDTVTKELIALSIGLALRYENCIYAHIQSAVKASATNEQILDAAGVAVMMGGGPIYTYLPRIMEALGEVGK